jgi:hypothetical protein
MASSSIGSRGGRWSGRGRCEEIRGSGWSFYRWSRRGRKRWQAPARIAAAAMMAHSGGDGMARGRRWRRDDSVTVWGRKAPIHAGERVNGEETGRAVAGDERVNGRSQARGRG